MKRKIYISKIKWLVISFLFINSTFSQKLNKISKTELNCLLENFEMFNIHKNIDSLIESSRKYNSNFISNYFKNKDTIFIVNKANIDDTLAVNYINNYFKYVYNIPITKKVVSLEENKNNISVFRNKKNRLFFKIFVQDEFKYSFMPIKDGVIAYLYLKSNYLKYVFKKQNLIKITLSNHKEYLSIFFDKKLRVKKISFTNTNYLSCLLKYKRVFYNGRKLKIK